MQSERLDAFHSDIGASASNAGCAEYVDGPTPVLGATIAAQVEMDNFVSSSLSLRPLLAVDISPVYLACSADPTFMRTQQLVVDSATIGDVLLGKWHLRNACPSPLCFPIRQGSTRPTTLSDIYEEMQWAHRTPFASSITIRNSASSVG